jgi:hypothetical protein
MIKLINKIDYYKINKLNKFSENYLNNQHPYS